MVGTTTKLRRHRAGGKCRDGAGGGRRRVELVRAEGLGVLVDPTGGAISSL